MKSYSGQGCDLAPDVDIIDQFINWWFHACMKGQIEIGWMDPVTGGLTHFRQFEIGDENIAKVAAAANAIPGQSVYFRASTVDRLGYPRTSDVNFVQSPGIWGDLDTPEQMERAKGVQTIIRPNGSIITGRHPHVRAQTFFRTEEPIVDGDLVRSLNKRGLALYGGDPAVVNPTRLMRLPGTIAWPWKAGRVPELTNFVLPTDSRTPAYPVAMLIAQLPIEQTVQMVPQVAAPNDAGAFGFAQNTVSGYISRIKSGREWHNNMVRLVAHWTSRGFTDAEVLGYAEAFTLPGYTVSQTLGDMRKALEGARRKWGYEEVDHAVGGEDDPAGTFPSEVVDPWDALKPPSFPFEVLPQVLSNFVSERSVAIGCDPVALAWMCISACSSAINGATRMKMKRHDNWSVPPFLWCALIGASSTKKSPIMSTAFAPIKARQGRQLQQWQETFSQWEGREKAEKDTPPPAQPIRFIANDATVEGLHKILARQDRGLALVHDELAGFITGMDRYSGGKGGSDRAFYLQAYDGGHYVVDRAGKNTQSIGNLLLSIVGGIQPDRLANFGDLADDGLWQRFLPVLVAPATAGFDQEASGESDEYRDLLNRIVDAAQMECVFSGPAHLIREQADKMIFSLEQGEALGGKFASFCGKLYGMFGRLSLVLNMIEPDSPLAPFVVGERNAGRALVLLRDSVIPMAARAYASMGSGAGTDGQAVKDIAGFILAQSITRLRASDLTRKVRACRGMSLSEVQAVISPLSAGGWLEPEKPHGGNNSWTVNPHVHAKFATRANKERTRRAAIRDIVTGNKEDDE